MTALWARILARYVIGAGAGVLVAAGLPADWVAMLKNDPEIAAGVAAIAAAGIEGVTALARKKGWKT